MLGHGDSGSGGFGSYAYADAWRIVEERFGGADFLLLLDHRSFVNVPHLLHTVLPSLPLSRVYAGVLLDQTAFGRCKGYGDTSCDYLHRRRVPVFAHGMGILVSADVAKFVLDMASKVALRSYDVPADAAFGIWVQPLEDLRYIQLPGLFHDWPASPADVADTLTGFSMVHPVLPTSTVVFRMTTRRWRRFLPSSCALAKEPPLAAGAATGSAVTSTPAQAAEAHLPEPAAPAEGQLDCWRGMSGRAESWYLVCCDIGWEGCWGGDFTAAACCGRPPPNPEADRAAAVTSDAAEGLDAMRRFLGFSHKELQLMLAALRDAADAPRPDRGRFACLTPMDCAREGFARFYQRSWDAGILPLRHPWIWDVQDHLFGLGWKLRAGNDGWGPKGHEHTFERVQLGEWLRLTSEHIDPEEVPGERRCLEWDSGQYSRRFFGRHCRFFDVLTYGGEGVAKVVEGSNGQRQYLLDIYKAEETIPADSTGVVVCGQVFEHLRRPHEAMRQLFRLLAPGGFVVWSAPMFSEVHGAPEDYFRFTPLGAASLAEDAGFVVVARWAPGGLREMAGYLMGITAPYWPKEDLLQDSGSTWPLQVYMLLQKPPGA